MFNTVTSNISCALLQDNAEARDPKYLIQPNSTDAPMSFSYEQTCLENTLAVFHFPYFYLSSLNGSYSYAYHLN